MSGDEYEAHIGFGGPLADYAPYVIGPHVNGVHAWDAVVPAHEREIEDAISEAFGS